MLLIQIAERERDNLGSSRPERSAAHKPSDANPSAAGARDRSGRCISSRLLERFRAASTRRRMIVGKPIPSDRSSDRAAGL